MGALENWIIFIDVICVSSLVENNFKVVFKNNGFVKLVQCVVLLIIKIIKVDVEKGKAKP